MAEAQGTGTGARVGRSRARTAGFYLVAFSLIGAVMFSGLELFCRLFDPLGISYYPETAAYLDTLVFEEPIGYRNRPHLTGRFYGAPVEINSLGLRDRELPSTPAPGEFRVAVLGDSFPFGIGVPYEQSIPQMLEKMLNQSRPPGVSFRTINMGVPSYNTEQQLHQFRTLGLNLHPDVAVLLFAVNDIYPKMWVVEKRMSWYTNLAQRSYAASFLVIVVRQAARRVTGDPGISVEGYRQGHPRWLAIDSSLTEIQALCKAAGIPFVVFYCDKLRQPLALLERVGVREGFPVIHLVPWSDPRWQGEDEREYANSAVDGHPNTEGSRIYATLIHERLRTLGVLPRPADASPRRTGSQRRLRRMFSSRRARDMIRLACSVRSGQAPC